MKRRLKSPAKRVAAVIGFLACASSAAAADEPAPARHPWSWSIVYKADVLGSTAPGGFAAMDNLDGQVDMDAAVLWGWDDTTLHGEFLANHGGKLNRRVGTLQGLSNIEVSQNSGRLYATWIEHQFKSTQTRVLVGLYDVNSEFYATDASGMLINPSFGIGIDFSQTGQNGPSIFPNLGLGVRIRQPVGEGGYFQLAALDGAPGDPDHPGRTVVRLRRSDGALLVAEGGWQQPGESGSRPGHWGVGLWQYTRPAPAIAGGPPQRNQGVYALAQGLLTKSGGGRSTGFVRAGAARRDVNSVDGALDAGVLVASPLGERGPRALTAGVAIAHLGHPADPSFRHETTFEIDARWQPWPILAVQPSFQWICHPNGRAGSAAVAGLRVEWTLEPK